MTVEVAKVNAYTVIKPYDRLSCSKVNLYGIITFSYAPSPEGVEVSKVNLYAAVVGLPKVQVSKVNLYTVVKTNEQPVPVPGFDATRAFVYDLTDGQIYPLALGYDPNQPKVYLRDAVIYPAVNQFSVLGGFGPYVVSADDKTDTVLNLQTVGYDLLLVFPMNHNIGWEFDGIDLQFDTTDVAIAVNVYYGDNADFNRVKTIFSGALAPLNNRLIVRGVNLRGKYMKLELSGALTNHLRIRRIDIAAWPRKDYV